MISTFRFWGTLVVLGLVVGEAGGALMHFPPFLPQQFLGTPLGATVLVVLASITLIGLYMWARTSSNANNRPYSLVIAWVGALAFVVNVLGPYFGFFGGLIFQGPVVLLAMLTALRAMAIIGLLLLLYRWSEARWPRLARLAYSLLLIGLVPVTIGADEMFLASGALTFGGGYTVWHDVVVGEILFAMPPIVYTVLRNRLSVRHDGND